MQTHTQQFMFTVTNQKQEEDEDKSQVTVQQELTCYKTSFTLWKHVCTWRQMKLQSK